MGPPRRTAFGMPAAYPSLQRTPWNAMPGEFVLADGGRATGHVDGRSGGAHAPCGPTSAGLWGARVMNNALARMANPVGHWDL